jgi:hypothetical protein
MEELFVFVEEFLKCKKELGVRYCEVFISAYKPEHQQIFYDAGFKPRGYIPSWEYSTKKSGFKDSVLFSIFEGTINDDIQLIAQGYELVQTLGLAEFLEASEDLGSISLVGQGRKRGFRFLDILDSRKLKSLLLTMMAVYLFLLIVSGLVAMGYGTVGFDITKHTISDLGNSIFTPAPFLFDAACGFAGAITVPYSFAIYGVMGNGASLRDRISTRVGLVCGVLGGLGYMCVGVFSLERSGPNGIVHTVSAVIAFIGFVLSILFFSLPVFFHQNIIYKVFGASGIALPLIMLLLNCILATPLLEWLLLISILIHIVPLNYWSVRK